MKDPPQHKEPLDQNSTRRMKSTHHYQERGKERKENGTRTLSEKKSSRKATNLPSHKYNSYSFDRFDFPRFVRSSVRFPRKKEKQKQRTLLASAACVCSTTPKNAACERKIGLEGTKGGSGVRIISYKKANPSQGPRKKTGNASTFIILSSASSFCLRPAIRDPI
jgi:hypothetical protein